MPPLGARPPAYPPLISPDQTWRNRAACLTENPDWFFPVSKSDPNTERARLICQGCAVINECLTLALELDERFGIWGGQTAFERRDRFQRGKRKPRPEYGRRQ